MSIHNLALELARNVLVNNVITEDMRKNALVILGVADGESFRLKESQLSVFISTADINTIFSELKAGKKIGAIKFIRNVTNIGLKEAKDLCETEFIPKLEKRHKP